MVLFGKSIGNSMGNNMVLFRFMDQFWSNGVILIKFMREIKFEGEYLFTYLNIEY